MRFGRLILLALLMVAPAAYSLDHSPPPSQKASTKDTQKATTAKDAGAEERLNKMESRMVRRDEQIDKRMKSTRRNDSGGRGRGR